METPGDMSSCLNLLAPENEKGEAPPALLAELLKGKPMLATSCEKSDTFLMRL